jgi:hypothetical protein
VATFNQPPNHVCAHSAETDHSELHLVLLSLFQRFVPAVQTLESLAPFKPSDFARLISIAGYVLDASKML